MKKKILITGSAGFIGFHLVKKLCLNKNNLVIGIDNFDNYYSPALKKKRNKILLKNFNYKFYKADIVNFNHVKKVFNNENIDYVVHLAAQAGVRYSLKNPKKYINTNINGFFNLIENSKNFNIKHFVYASSSSVYGLNKVQPFSEKHKTETPTSLYGATKKSNELIAHSYSNVYGIRTTGLRFFTVYGPYGRPDMSLFLFTEAIFRKKKVNLFNKGNMRRSFTYIDDIISGVEKIVFKIPKNKNSKNKTKNIVPFEIYNLGNQKDEGLLKYLKTIEKQIGKKSKVKKLGMQVGDVKSTKASMTKFRKKFNYSFKNDIDIGISKFVNWYKQFYKV